MKHERSRKDGVSTRLPASDQSNLSDYKNRRTGLWLGPHCPRGRLVKFQATLNRIITSSYTVRRVERHAAPTGGQCKPVCPDVSMMESPPLYSKPIDSTASLPSVCHRSRGSPISSRTLLPATLWSWHVYGLHRPNRGSSPADFYDNLHSLQSWIWLCGGTALRLASWNADGVCVRKRAVPQHGVHTSLVSKTCLGSGQSLGFAQYSWHRTARPTGEGTAMLLRRVYNSCCASLGPAAPGGYCRTPDVFGQTSEACAHKTRDRFAPDRMSKQKFSHLNGGWSQREVRGLEF
jgi:hypothetical protein